MQNNHEIAMLKIGNMASSEIIERYIEGTSGIIETRNSDCSRGLRLMADTLDSKGEDYSNAYIIMSGLAHFVHGGAAIERYMWGEDYTPLMFKIVGMGIYRAGEYFNMAKLSGLKRWKHALGSDRELDLSRWDLSDFRVCDKLDTDALSYLPNDVQAWAYNCDANNRIMIAPPKLIRLLNRLGGYWTEKINDAELEIAIHQIMTLWNNDNILEEYTFERTAEVVEGYNEASRIEDLRSCMVTERDTVAGQLRFYEHIGAELLIARDNNGTMVGRAIVWDDVIHDGEVKTYVDRVYPNNSTVSEAVREYARRQGWLVRPNDNAENSRFDDALNNMYRVVRHNMDHYDGRMMPWGDTFKVACNIKIEGVYHTGVAITRDVLKDQYGAAAIQDTRTLDDSAHEDSDNDDMTYCENCESRVWCEDTGRVITSTNSKLEELDEQYWCDGCCENSATDVNGTLYQDDLVTQLHDGTYAYSEDCTKCESCKEFYQDDDMVRSVEDEPLCRDCAIEADDEYYKPEHIEQFNVVKLGSHHPDNHRREETYRTLDGLSLEADFYHEPMERWSWHAGLMHTSAGMLMNGFKNDVYHCVHEDGDVGCMSFADAYVYAVAARGNPDIITNLHEVVLLDNGHMGNSSIMASIASQELLYKRYLAVMASGNRASLKLISDAINNASWNIEQIILSDDGTATTIACSINPDYDLKATAENTCQMAPAIMMLDGGYAIVKADIMPDPSGEYVTGTLVNIKVTFEYRLVALCLERGVRMSHIGWIAEQKPPHGMDTTYIDTLPFRDNLCRIAPFIKMA